MVNKYPQKLTQQPQDHEDCEDEHQVLIKAARWSSVQSIVVADNFLRMLHFTSVLTEAYSLARNVGQGAVWSGLLISSAWALAFVGALVGWQLAKLQHLWVHRVVTFAPWWTAFVTLLYAIGANPPGDFIGNHARQVLLLSSRFSYGLGVSIQGVVLNTSGARVTPSKDMVELELYKQCARTLGIGGGPLLSALCSAFVDDSDIASRSAVPAMVLSLIWAAFAVWTRMCFTDDVLMQEMVDAKDREDERRGLERRNSEDTPLLGRRLVPGSLQFIDSRRAVICLGALYGVERSFIVSALESATCFILETEFAFSTAKSGLAVGTTFLASLPLMLVVKSQYARGGKQRRSDDMSLMKACTTICCASSLLLFAPLRIASGVILLACAIVFSTSYLASSVSDGLALSYTMPDTLFSLENYVLVDQIAQNTIARCIGPILARYVIEHLGGRFAYAGLQLLVSLFGVAICYALRTAQQRCVQQLATRKDPMKSLKTGKPDP